jgi:hypothetical protein
MGSIVATNPLQPPTIADLLSNPIVQQALEDAWTDSMSGDPARRHEEGGWIYMELVTEDISIRRTPAGGKALLPLDLPPIITGSVVVGTFHTHPNPTAEGWEPGPSPNDQFWATQSGVPWLIRADDGVYATGPNCRRGGLGGAPGFPS